MKSYYEFTIFSLCVCVFISQKNPQIIPPPELFKVKTDSDNKITLFEDRAKLLRFVKETKEWKERGIGNMKVMVNKKNPNNVRLLMRREQVLKVCCEQLLAKDNKFNKMPNIETALIWARQYYSGNEPRVKIFAIRFKTADICKQFHQVILSAQANMTDGKSQQAKSTKDEKPAETKGFGDLFKPQAGSWTCEMCYTSNTCEILFCVCCEEPKDDMVPKKKKPNIFGSSHGKLFFLFSFYQLF